MLKQSCVSTQSVGLVTACVLALIGCEAPRGAESSRVAVKTQPLGIRGGSIPIPVAPCPQELDGGASGSSAPVVGGTCEAASRPVVWDGTYAELLAADALAECTLLQAVERPPSWTFSPFITRMMTLMSNASCPLVEVTEPMSFDDIAEQWISQRRDARCNAQPGSGSALAREFDYESFQSVGADSAYYLPSGALPSGVERDSLAAYQVQIEAVNSYVDLCVARKLKEHLDSEQIVFASEGEVEQLYALVRDRSLSSVLQYSMLVGGFAVDLPMTYSTSIIDGNNILPLFGEWRRWSLAQPAESDARKRFAQIGRDFALAISLLVDASETETEHALRNPDGPNRFGSYLLGATDELSGPNDPSYYGMYFSNPAAGSVPEDPSYRLRGSRVDVLRRTYGALSDDVDPSRLRQPSMNVFGGRAPVQRMSGDLDVRASTVDMSAPEIGVLLGLARSADALDLKAVNDIFDVRANGRAMLEKIESKQRERDCKALGNTDPMCWAIAPTDSDESFTIRRRVGVGQEHADALVRSLIEHIFGVPARGDVDGNLLDFSQGANTDSRGLQLPPDLLARVPGRHTFTGDFAGSGGGTLHLDKKAVLSSDPTSLQGQAWAYLPPRRLRWDRNAWDQGFWSTYSPSETSLGTVPTLVLARHTLLNAEATVGEVVEAARPALDLLDAAIGTRSMLVRPAITWASAFGTVDTTNFVMATPTRSDNRGGLRYDTSTGCPTCVRWRGARTYEIELYRKPEDLIEINRAVVLPNPTSRVPQTMGMCSGAVTSPSAPCRLPLTSTQTTTASSGQLLVSSVTLGADAQLVDLGWSNDGKYTGVMRGRLDVGVPRFLRLISEQTTFGRAVALGGSLNAQAQEAWSMQQGDWSRPNYDALGVLSTWTPAGDASLHGGEPGEEAYQYFLRSARSAAIEASSARQQAYDTLLEEASDEIALIESEVRGKALVTAELAGLCGASCDPAEFACRDGSGNPIACPAIRIPVRPCDANLAPDDLLQCNLYYRMIHQLLGQQLAPSTRGSFVLSAPVYGSVSAPRPDFSAFRGTELESLFIEQWSAWQELETTIQAAQFAFTAGIASRAASIAELDQARVEYDQAVLDTNAAFAELISRGVGLVAQADTFRLEQAALVLDFQGLQAQRLTRCNPMTFARAQNSGFSYTSGKEAMDSYDNVTNFIDTSYNQTNDGPYATCEQELWTYTEYECDDLLCGLDISDPDERTRFVYVEPGGEPGEGWVYVGNDIGPCRFESYSYSPGAYLSLLTECEVASVGEMYAGWAGMARWYGMQAQIQALETQAQLLVYPWTAAEHGPATAFARWTTALWRVNESQHAMWSQGSAHLSQIQAAYDRLFQSQALIDNAIHRTAITAMRIGFETNLDMQIIKSQFGLRRIFKSYELTRARDLTDRARRLAVAARRAIESRFVVDLSKLNAAEPFVDAPAAWADRIYDDELSITPSLVVDTPETPATNAIEDYVGKLDLFVKGFAVQRPSSTARFDVDIIQLPAPAPVSRDITSDGVAYSYVDPSSAGWSFYCAQTGTWFENPDSSSFAPMSWELGSVCFGEPPSHARLAFTLDPWGRVNGHYTEAPYNARYNARWRRFAVNLVGSGIRDCSQVDDAASCYAEPFIRYDLRHVGPAWVTTYDAQWREQSLPTAQVEGGKALATEEWLDPVANSFNIPTVANVARAELAGRPLGGAYELTVELTPDIRVERIERIQVLAESDYWVRQQDGDEPEQNEGAPICGDGFVDPPEVCDGDCPTQCASDGNACTADVLVGLTSLCNVTCAHQTVTACSNGDRCCPSGCTFENDLDCVMPGCGNGSVSSEEQCDPGAAGETMACDRNCTLASCGDYTVNVARGELCDGNCPTSCSDGNACTTDALTGSSAACNAQCTHTAVTSCVSADGCCPAACTSATDSDCLAECGNGVVEQGETCDGNCPSTCTDANACTADLLSGSAAGCNVTCYHDPINSCEDGDGCCALGCNSINDAECVPVCGNGVIEPAEPGYSAETCDGSCPANCNDNNGCTTDSQTGSAAACTIACTNTTTITTCVNADGCCAAGCNSLNDSDCPPVCGNSLVEAGEACDGNCPTSCSEMDGDPCTLSILQGTGCQRQCVDDTTCTSGNACCAHAQYACGADSDCGQTCSGGACPTVTTGAGHTCALQAGQLWCWGRNNYGQLGTGNTTSQSSPTRIGTLSDWTWVGAGQYHTCAMRSGSLFCWGRNVEGQLGTGNTTNLSAPPATSVGTFTDWSAAALGFNHTCAIRNGGLYCWGSNANGQLGTGNTTSISSVPASSVGGFTTWTQITAGQAHACGMRSGSAYCWGLNMYGMLGDGTTIQRTSPPASTIGGFTDWAVLSGGSLHTCGLRTNGQAYCWGYNADGQLGRGNTTSSNSPVLVTGSYVFTAISTGANSTSTCGLVGGSPYCWGRNSFGQVGNNTTTTPITSPTPITTFGDWKIVNAGGLHTCGRRLDDFLYCWGSDTYGQVGNGSAGTSNVLAPQNVTPASW